MSNEQTTPDEEAAIDQWFKTTEERVEKLNKSAATAVFEVSAAGVLVAGDIILSKGEEDEFEATLEGIKPGLWAISGTASGEEGVVLLRWFAAGALDFENLPSAPEGTEDDDEGDWEKLGTFSVDSGSVGIFDQRSLEPASLGLGMDKEVALEYFMDVPREIQIETERPAYAVPGGAVLGGNDGGYTIYGQKDKEGRVVFIKLECA